MGDIYLIGNCSLISEACRILQNWEEQYDDQSAYIQI
jgi:hypothetical protein